MSGNSTPKPELRLDSGVASERERRDNSLRGNALRRATTGRVPSTLTPWEWEEWYGKHGMPSDFVDAKEKKGGWWQRLWRFQQRR